MDACCTDAILTAQKQSWDFINSSTPPNINELVALIKSPDHIQPANLQSVLDSLSTISAEKDGAKRCAAAGAVPAALSLLTTQNDVLYSDLKYQHSLLQLLLRLLLAGGEATESPETTPAPELVVAALSKRLLRVSDTATSLCLSVLLALCGVAGGAHSAPHVEIFRSAVIDQMPSVSGKLVLVLQVSSDAAAKRKAAALLRLGSS